MGEGAIPGRSAEEDMTASRSPQDRRLLALINENQQTVGTRPARSLETACGGEESTVRD